MKSLEIMGNENSSLADVSDDHSWSTDYFDLHTAHLVDGIAVSAFVYKPSNSSGSTQILVNNYVKVSTQIKLSLFFYPILLRLMFTLILGQAKAYSL